MIKNKSLCPFCKKTWDRCKCDLKKDFGVEMGSKEEAEWKTIYDNAINSIAQSKRAIELNEICAAHAKKRMEEEKAKFESNA